MPIHQSIADTITQIAHTHLPAMIIDTCAAFDIVRCAHNGEPRVAGIARQMIEAHISGELLLYGPSVLEKEAARNRIEVESEARRKARHVDQSMVSYRQAARYIGENYPHTAVFTHESLIPSLMALHDQLLATCIHILPDDSLKSAAFARASDNRRPARKGGGANDCLLFEEFRRVAHALPAADPLILLTTNPEDFTDKSQAGAIHHEIAGGLIGTKAKLCLEWDWAAGCILSQARLSLI